jgi:hypothetical protein
MKATMLMLAAAGLCLAGCGDDSKATKAVAAVSNTVTAPVDYLGALGAAKQRSEKTLDIVQVNQAVMYFHEAEDRYPNDLNELVAKHYLGEIPKAPYGMKLVYDPATGTVQVVKQ